jgi:hypothetical protein
VRALRAADIRDDEMLEGGEAIASHWWRKKGEREASRTIVLKCQDYVRMVRAIASLEPLSTAKRTNIDVRMPLRKLGSRTSLNPGPKPPRSAKRAPRPTRWPQKPGFASRDPTLLDRPLDTIANRCRPSSAAPAGNPGDSRSNAATST